MNSIPIILAFTPNYIIPAATTILSILCSSESTDKFEIICLLTEDLPLSMSRSLEDWDKDRLSFSFINLGDKLEGVYIDERYTAAASYRLLLPDILPNYQNVIYLDCDVIVRNNLADLFRNIEMGNNYLAAVFEATLSFQLSYLDRIGCQPGKYINSGFLIMNLEEMRKDGIATRLIEKSNNPNSEFPDQDALNIVCVGRILGLSPVYNSIRTYFLPQYKSDFLNYYSEEDWRNVQQHGTVHYTGSKPWNGYTVEFTTWWKVYKQLPTSIKRLGEVNTKVKSMASLLSVPIMKGVFNTIQFVYRKIKRK